MCAHWWETNERCGWIFAKLAKVHSTPSAQQGRQPWHQITNTSRSGHETMCQLWQSHRAEPCGQLVDQRHVQGRSQSHDLVTGGGHTANQLQPLRAIIW